MSGDAIDPTALMFDRLALQRTETDLNNVISRRGRFLREDGIASGDMAALLAILEKVQRMRTEADEKSMRSSMSRCGLSARVLHMRDSSKGGIVGRLRAQRDAVVCGFGGAGRGGRGRRGG